MLLGNWDWDNGKAEFKTGEPKVNSIVSIAVFLSAFLFFLSFFFFSFFGIMHIFEDTKLITIDLI